jgi:hypothetical protein
VDSTTPEPFILTIDPGHHGAAVLEDTDGEARWAWRWVQLKRGTGKGQTEYHVYRLDSEPRDGVVSSSEHQTLGGVGAELARQLEGVLAGGRVHLVAEGLFVHSMARSETAITLGKMVGWLTAALLERALSYDEPKACEWRPVVLGCDPLVPSEHAERLALLRWGRRWSGELRDDPHVAEADCMGHYRRVALNPRQALLLQSQPAPRRRRAGR